MSSSTTTKVIDIVSSVLGVPVDKLNESSSPESVSAWESMKHINLVLALEEEFDVQFDDEQISQLKNVGAIVSLVDMLLEHESR
jgi:acyl carrier protein